MFFRNIKIALEIGLPREANGEVIYVEKDTFLSSGILGFTYKKLVCKFKGPSFEDMDNARTYDMIFIAKHSSTSTIFVTILSLVIITILGMIVYLITKNKHKKSLIIPVDTFRKKTTFIFNSMAGKSSTTNSTTNPTTKK